MATYSFQDVAVTLLGPNGVVSLGYGSASAKEGITVEMAEDKNTRTTGADGAYMNALHAGNSGMITVRLLKTSPVNAQLSAMYAEQKSSSSLWGKNSFVVSDVARGDFITAEGGAFKKFPSVVYAEEGPMNEWVFDAGAIVHLLGVGIPDVSA